MTFLLLIVFLSTLSGSTSWYEIEDYAEEYEEGLKNLYETLAGHRFPHTILSHDTFNRSISLLDVEGFEGAYKRWINGFISSSSGKHICIDGKTMRGVKKLFLIRNRMLSLPSRHKICAVLLNSTANGVLTRWKGLKSIHSYTQTKG